MEKLGVRLYKLPDDWHNSDLNESLPNSPLPVYYWPYMPPNKNEVLNGDLFVSMGEASTLRDIYNIERNNPEMNNHLYKRCFNDVWWLCLKNI
jgi:hypothetical protein